MLYFVSVFVFFLVFTVVLSSLRPVGLGRVGQAWTGLGWAVLGCAWLRNDFKNAFLFVFMHFGSPGLRWKQNTDVKDLKQIVEWLGSNSRPWG